MSSSCPSLKFSKDLGDLLWQDAETPAKTDEVGLLDGDLLNNAQDMEIMNLGIYPARLVGNEAEVRAGFTSFSQKKRIYIPLIGRYALSSGNILR